jgi:hypothetical protein
MAGDYVTLRTLHSTIPIDLPGKDIPIAQQTGGVRLFSEALIASIFPMEALDAAKAHQVADVEASAEFDRRLHATCVSQNDPGAFLCLRCRCSHSALSWLKATFAKYVARDYHLEPMEMVPCLLNDDGRVEVFRRGDAVAPLPGEVRYESFLMEVVRSFNPQKGAGLNTWTQLRAESNKCLAVYFRSIGLLLKSSWSILAHDAGPKNMVEAWMLYGSLPLNKKNVLALLSAYQQVYKTNDERKQRGWLPSNDFFRAVAPDQEPQQTEDQLLAMAQALRDRQAPWCQPRDPQHHHSLDEVSPQEAEPATLTNILDDSLEDDQQQLELIDSALARAMDEHMPSLLANIEAMDEQRRCIWLAYAQGMNNRQIASQCHCGAGTASKKVTGPLNLRLRTVAKQALKELKRNGHCADEIGNDLGATEKAEQALLSRMVEPLGSADARHDQHKPSMVGLWITNRFSHP